MCTYLTEKVSISGSGKGPADWFRLTDASVYFDHPVHAQAEHTLNIDFLDPGAGPSARVAVELTAESARALAKAIQATLDSAPPGLVPDSGGAPPGLRPGGPPPDPPPGGPPRTPLGTPGMSVPRASMHVRPPRRVAHAGWRRQGMRFIVGRDVLAEAVAWVARSLPSRPVLPILSGLLLEASSDGLTLSCFDYEVSARILLDAEIAEAGTALVPGRLLAEITRSLPPLPVEVEDEKDDVTVTCGPASFTLVTLPVKEYPRLPELPRLAGTVDGGVLATAIGQVVPAASRDDTLPVITGVNLEIDDDTIMLVATDRYRLAIRELGWNPAHPGNRGTLLVPAKTLSEATRMMTPGVPVRVMMRGEQGAADGRRPARSPRTRCARPTR